MGAQLRCGSLLGGLASLSLLAGCPAAEQDSVCDTDECPNTDPVASESTEQPPDTDTFSPQTSTGSTSGSTSGSDGSESSDSSGGPSFFGGCDGSETPSGLAIRDLSAFQVVEIPMVDDCDPVAPDTRPLPLVAGRPTAFRASIDVAPDAAGSTLALEVLVVSGEQLISRVGPCVTVDSQHSPLEAHVEIDANIEPGATYSVQISQCDPGEGFDARYDRFPAAGGLELGAQDTGVMRLHVVPFEVGGFVPDHSQEVLDGFRDAIVAHYPVRDVEITVEAVQPDTGEGQVDMGELMSRLIGLQEDRVFASGDVDPSVADIYYYGLVTGAATRGEFCDSCPTGTSEAGLGERAGSAMGAAFADELSQSTLIHELGHMHGLLHSPCGDPDLQDTRFPYVDGSTQSEGWDFRSGTFIPADHNDLMGYCQPRWVSDYHYAKMVEWVELARTWTAQKSKMQPGGELHLQHCSVPG